MPYAAKIKSDPGGRHKDFLYTWKIEMNKDKVDKSSVTGETPNYRMKILKSSLGKTRGWPLEVPYISRYNEEGEEFINYDWNEALINLLDGDSVSKTELNKVMELKVNGRKCSSSTLGLKDVTASELGAAIHADEELVKTLQRDILRIRTKRVFGRDVLSSKDVFNPDVKKELDAVEAEEGEK